MVAQILESDNRLDPEIKIRVTDVSCTGTCGFITCTIIENEAFTNKNFLFSWGSGPCLGLGPKITTAKIPTLVDNVFFGNFDEKFGNSWIMDVNGGLEHVIVRMSDGGCYGWGRNDDGRLGNNTLRNLNYP